MQFYRIFQNIPFRMRRSESKTAILSHIEDMEESMGIENPNLTSLNPTECSNTLPEYKTFQHDVSQLKGKFYKDKKFRSQVLNFFALNEDLNKSLNEFCQNDKIKRKNYYIEVYKYYFYLLKCFPEDKYLVSLLSLIYLKIYCFTSHSKNNSFKDLTSVVNLHDKIKKKVDSVKRITKVKSIHPKSICYIPTTNEKLSHLNSQFFEGFSDIFLYTTSISIKSAGKNTHLKDLIPKNQGDDIIFLIYDKTIISPLNIFYLPPANLLEQRNEFTIKVQTAGINYELREFESIILNEFKSNQDIIDMVGYNKEFSSGCISPPHFTIQWHIDIIVEEAIKTYLQNGGKVTE